MSCCECACYRKYRHLPSNESNIEKYIAIELLTTNIDIKIFSNIVQPYNLLMEISQNGISIGASYLGMPKCKDDQLLFATSHQDLPAMLKDTQNTMDMLSILKKALSLS